MRLRPSASHDVVPSATTPGPWTALPPLAHKRWLHNTVLLPDGRVFVVGGEKSYTSPSCSDVPALTPEVLDPTSGTWTSVAPHTIIRDYHSTAVLLPDATVLCGGGESRRNQPGNGSCAATGTRGQPAPGPWDYQRWNPHYLQCGNQRPQILNGAAPGAATQWTRGQQYSVKYNPLGFPVAIGKVCLVRAGSVTHHADTNQRCAELQFEALPDTEPPSQSTVLVTIPTTASGLLPRGYYMLFLVTNQGVPSAAAWVKVL